jgi:hypothetical protein
MNQGASNTPPELLLRPACRMNPSLLFPRGVDQGGYLWEVGSLCYLMVFTLKDSSANLHTYCILEILRCCGKGDWHPVPMVCGASAATPLIFKIDLAAYHRMLIKVYHKNGIEKLEKL